MQNFLSKIQTKMKKSKAIYRINIQISEKDTELVGNYTFSPCAMIFKYKKIQTKNIHIEGTLTKFISVIFKRHVSQSVIKFVSR